MDFLNKQNWHTSPATPLTWSRRWWWFSPGGTINFLRLGFNVGEGSEWVVGRAGGKTTNTLRLFWKPVRELEKKFKRKNKKIANVKKEVFIPN